MDALIRAAKDIEHYYLTGALQGNLGLADNINDHGEVLHMDQITEEITNHYLLFTQSVKNPIRLSR
jgi:hypothetical protein